MGIGQVKFMFIDRQRSTAGILLYLENYEDTYYCAKLNNNVESEYFGLAGDFMWD